MGNLKQLTFDELIDLLAEHTSQYTKMIKSKTFNDEFDSCKRKIKAIQSEIAARKRDNVETPR